MFIQRVKVILQRFVAPLPCALVLLVTARPLSTNVGNCLLQVLHELTVAAAPLPW